MMSFPRQKTFDMPVPAQFLLAVSLAALAFVFVMQYGFGLRPCILCLWQRAPYGATALLSALAWGWKPYGRHSAVLLALCAGFFLAGFGLAFFHSGVELHWWLGTSSCSIQPLAGATAEDLRQSLLHSVAPRCEEIAWSFLGLSMANWNIAVSLFLAFFATGAAAKAVQD